MVLINHILLGVVVHLSCLYFARFSDWFWGLQLLWKHWTVFLCVEVPETLLVGLAILARVYTLS